MAQHTYEADLTEHYYLEKTTVEDCCDTSPLLLDTVLSFLPENSVRAIHCKQQVPSVRQERDQALYLALHYRHLAEASHSRTLRYVSISRNMDRFRY